MPGSNFQGLDKNRLQRPQEKIKFLIMPNCVGIPKKKKKKIQGSADRQRGEGRLNNWLLNNQELFLNEDKRFY